jgi:diguanylate cyclase (GGDEF)-like protein/PAS domain S-box-containing protein
MVRSLVKSPALHKGQGLFFGIVCALLVWAMSTGGWLRNLERSTLDALFKTRRVIHPSYASPDIIVLKADDATVARYGRWPLPRTVYADLVRHLTQAGARTIAFDILLTVPSDIPAADKALVQASEESKRVVHAMAFNFLLAKDPFVSTSSPGNAPTLLSRFRITDDDARTIQESNWGSTAILSLQQSAAGIGHVNVPPEQDGVRRRIPHTIRFKSANNSALYPSLALATASHFLGVRPHDVVAKPDSIALKLPDGTNRSIPVDSQGRTWINWIGPDGSFKTHSFNEVLDGAVDDGVFKNKIVLIGITAAGAFEQQATPFSGVQAAVEVQANAINDILLNRPLLTVSPAIWLFLFWAFPIAVGTATMRQSARASAAITIGFCIVLWVAALIALTYFSLVLPVTVPITVGLLTWGVCIGYRQAREAINLKLAEERYSLAVRGANDGIWDWNLETGEVYFSQRWKAILGYEDGNFNETIDEWYSRVHPDDLEQMKAQLEAHISGGIAHFESRHRMKHRDGRWIWVLSRGLRVCNESGKPSRMAGSQSDITEQVEAREQLERNAFYDALTGLPNRALFMDVLARALGRSRRREDYKFAILFLDLDRFKTVNDSLGHTAGDDLLISVARRLEACLRPGDTAARLGGDEFTLLLDDISEIGVATRVADRIQQELSKPFDLSGHEVYPTSSIGIAISSPTYQFPEELLRDADTAMYRAKALGRARHAIFDEEMHAHAISLLKLETDLRRALEHQDFLVVYQPIVALASGEVMGFEALVRWNHAERGMVSPGEFIPLAEETGLIIPLDRIVLREACTQLCAWQDLFPDRSLTISVNLSGKQFTQSDLVPEIKSLLDEVGLSPRSLKLEMTEGVLMDNPEIAAAMLHELRELGIRLSIDDFGTGYSSLSYLHRFPLDTLKVDQSFVKRMGPDGENFEIVRTIVSLARNLNMDVIAEGVETIDQMKHLRGIQCDYGQGYFFAKPLDATMALQLLSEGGHWQPELLAERPTLEAIGTQG